MTGSNISFIIQCSKIVNFFRFFQISSLDNTFLNYIILYLCKEGLDLGKIKVLNEAALKELVMPQEG